MQRGRTQLECRIAVYLLAFVVVPMSAGASEEDLQKKLANPVSDLITVPLQYTATFDVGPESGRQDTLNLQPVYPITLGRWNLINRLIVPLVSAPAFGPAQGRVSGIGDIAYEGFFSPAAAHRFIWGAGPIVQLNSASNDRLGSGHTSAGPAIVALQQSGPWSIGALVTQSWSFAGDEQRAAVSQFQFQPILSFTVDPKHTVSFNGTIVANWHAKPSSEVWTVPIGMTYSILTRRPGSIPHQLHRWRRLQRRVSLGRRRVVRPLSDESDLCQEKDDIIIVPALIG